MNIESEVFQFHPAYQFEKLQISELQKQYLADLRAQNSLQALIERYLANGWLVNFQLLYDLVSLLAKHNWILNPNINNYFGNLQIRNSIDKNSHGKAPIRIASNFSTENLLQLPFFRSLQIDLARFLLSQAQLCKYGPDSMVCKTGDSSRELYVLLKGELGVYRRAATFKQFISMLPVCSVFGEAGFLLGEKRTADVVVLKASEILVIPYQAEVLDRYLNIEKAQNLKQRFWVQHALLHSDFFKNTPPDCLDALTFTGKVMDLPDQQILFKQGDMGHSAYIVIQGSLQVMQNGKMINTLPQGSFLGEISLMMNDGRRTATVIGQRNTKLLEIHRNEFYKLLAKNLYLAKEFQLLADQRLQKDTNRLQKA